MFAARLGRTGKPLMPWQQHVADVAMEIDPATGRLAYREVVLTVPRQSGKSTLMLAVLVHRMLAMGRPQVAAFTMQNGLQARMRLRREWHEQDLKLSPALRSTYTPSLPTGAEALMFHNGSRLEVVAGRESSGHGSTLDLAMVDEAFGQSDDRLEQALRPAMITRPDAQIWWVSTAGSETDTWFRAKVEHARRVADGASGVAVFEWSAPDGADHRDRRVWWECMPALGLLRADGSGTSEADVAAELLNMGEAGFRRAYMNQWVRRRGAGDLPGWESLARSSDPSSSAAVGVDLGEDRLVSLAAGWRRQDGGIHVQLTGRNPMRPDVGLTVAQAIPRIVEVSRALGGAPVVLHGPAVDLDRELGAVRRMVMNGPAFAAASGALADAVRDRTLSHGNQPELTSSALNAQFRAVGMSGERALQLRGSLGVGPIAAVVRAVHGVLTGSSSPITQPVVFGETETAGVATMQF